MTFNFYAPDQMSYIMQFAPLPWILGCCIWQDWCVGIVVIMGIKHTRTHTNMQWWKPAVWARRSWYEETQEGFSSPWKLLESAQVLTNSLQGHAGDITQEKNIRSDHCWTLVVLLRTLVVKDIIILESVCHRCFQTFPLQLFYVSRLVRVWHK